MTRINLIYSFYLFATIFTVKCILTQQQQFYRKPWPAYSLENMPQTQFTCHDKILGGYYADAETQCQMFHICVKVAGVGVQDFRFLCPNGTAFDQEAQICADWGDVDCVQSVLYYGSDNFDLYRLGSGFESKRAPYAEEEEATFHLQRAESNDIRRSKETRVDQKSRPQQPPNYNKQLEASTQNAFIDFANVNRNSASHNHNRHNNNNNNNNGGDVTRRPIANYYTPTTTTKASTTEKYNDDSKQDLDEIFKGSHSSHFFANRNGGREDDLIDYHKRPKSNDFTSDSKKSDVIKSNSKSQAYHQRHQHATSTTATTTRVTTTAVPATSKLNKNLTLHTSYNVDFLAVTRLHKLVSTTSPPVLVTTQRSTTKVAHDKVNQFSVTPNNNYLTNEKIQPTTYNPGNSIYRIKVTTPKYFDHKATSVKQNDHGNSINAPAAFESKRPQKFDRHNDYTQQKQKNFTFSSPNEFADFSKVKLEQPKPFQAANQSKSIVNTQVLTAPNTGPQYYRVRPQTLQKAKVGIQEPAPFAAPKKFESKATQNSTQQVASQRGHANRGSINYKATTQRSQNEFSISTTQAHHKKFSTLVPKELYTPTTFKPTTYNKPVANFDYNFYQAQQTVRPHNVNNNKQQKHHTTTTTTVPTTANPYYNPDEDDGQYHPELYETDFPRNRLNLHRSTSSPITTTVRAQPNRFNFDDPQIHLKTQQQTAFQKQQQQQQNNRDEKPTPTDLSDEEELFKTAHSLNFGAASINKLRADIIKAEKKSQQYNSQYSPQSLQTSSSPKSSTTAQQTTKASTPASTTRNLFTSFSTHPTATPVHHAVASTTTNRYANTYLPTSSTTTSSSPRIQIQNNQKKSSKSTSKGKKSSTSSKAKPPKRPPHADEDTSYDYAYYDTDSLSESPQEYAEYEISEFVKTKKKN